jgi:hypothetical protein
MEGGDASAAVAYRGREPPSPVSAVNMTRQAAVVNTIKVASAEKPSIAFRCCAPLPVQPVSLWHHLSFRIRSQGTKRGCAAFHCVVVRLSSPPTIATRASPKTSLSKTPHLSPKLPGGLQPRFLSQVPKSIYKPCTIQRVFAPPDPKLISYRPTLGLSKYPAYKCTGSTYPLT